MRGDFCHIRVVPERLRHAGASIGDAGDVADAVVPVVEAEYAAARPDLDGVQPETWG
jgi:hypothetical protein